MMRRLLAVAVAALAIAGLPVPSPAATAARAPTPPPGAIDVTKAQPKELLPKTALHTEFIVEVNKLGQVSRVRSGKWSKNVSFNEHTYGNALQAFIRTPDGKAIPGVYKLTYDYNPKTTRVRRDVALVKRGGVNAGATGAATQMMAIARKNRNRTPPPVVVAPAPSPANVDAKRLPDLPQVMKTPAH